MKKDQEVELRVLVKNMDKDQTRGRILALGAVSHGIRNIHDTYYCDNSCKVVEDAEMNRVGSFSIRIRKEIRDGVTIITYNKKIITREGDHHSWQEEEEVLDDIEKAEKEVISAGNKFFFSLEKAREVFGLDDMEICLEDIVDFGLGIEVEVMTTKEESESSIQRIKKLFTTLGISNEDILPKSITNIIMHERAFKDPNIMAST